MSSDQSAEPAGRGHVTALLAAWSAGDPTAVDRLLPIVYVELKAIARRTFRRERGDHTLQPTALVHEAFLKLAGGGRSFNDRAHFFAVACKAMRQVLVDHARAHASVKRGGGETCVELPGAAGGSEREETVNVLAVDEIVSRLAALDPAQARLVELRFFGGLTVEETAEVLAVSSRTVKRDWRLARAFLARELGVP